MNIVDLGTCELQEIRRYGSMSASSTELASGAGEAHVHFVEIKAGGEIGPHVAGFGQLFVCLAGEGWVASANEERLPLRQGQAAYIARGERHSKGATTNLRALIIQVRDIGLLVPERDDRYHPGSLAELPAAHPRFQIREYRPADHSEWLRMRRALWPEIARADEIEDAAVWIARADAVVIVAARRNTNGLAGFAELGARPYADGCDTSPVAYLEGWYVDEDARRQGAGTALVRAGEVWARRQGYRELASDALLDNTTSHFAHLALGFTEVERAIRYRKLLD